MNARAQEGTGGVKAPAATDSASVMVVPGNARCARSAQFAAAAGLAAHASDVNAAKAGRNRKLLSVIDSNASGYASGKMKYYCTATSRDAEPAKIRLTRREAVS
jgi:hypothetical protein